MISSCIGRNRVACAHGHSLQRRYWNAIQDRELCSSKITERQGEGYWKNNATKCRSHSGCQGRQLQKSRGTIISRPDQARSMKDKVWMEYFRGVKRILNGSNTICVINIWAVSHAHYTERIVKWEKTNWRRWTEELGSWWQYTIA